MRVAAPGEHLLWCQPMSARNHRHRCSWLQRLLDDPRLVVHRPTTTPAGTGDHLDATDLVLKLKRRFKSRHKPIPISLQDQHNHRSATRQKGALRTPLTHANWGRGMWRHWQRHCHTFGPRNGLACAVRAAAATDCSSHSTPRAVPDGLSPLTGCDAQARRPRSISSLLVVAISGLRAEWSSGAQIAVGDPNRHNLWDRAFG